MPQTSSYPRTLHRACCIAKGGWRRGRLRVKNGLQRRASRGSSARRLTPQLRLLSGAAMCHKRTRALHNVDTVPCSATATVRRNS